MYSVLEVSQSFGKIEDILQYKITIKNEDEPVYQVKFEPKLPQELYFLKGEILGDRNLVVEEVVGTVLIGDMQAGEKKIIIINAQIRSFPVNNPITYMFDLEYLEENNTYQTTISNAVITLVNDPNINVKSQSLNVKTNKVICDRGEEITYSIGLKNRGNVSAESLKLWMLTPREGVIIEETIKGKHCTPVYDGVSQMIQIDGLGVQEEAEIVYTVKLLEKISVSDQSHTIQASYAFKMANRQLVTQNVQSEKVPLFIETAYFAPDGFVKKCTRKIATLMDYLTYEIYLHNRGNVTALDVLVRDHLVEGLRFVEGSVKINQESCPHLNVQEGIQLGDIKGNQKVSLSYEVCVEALEANKEQVMTTAYMAYSYIVDEQVIQTKEVANAVEVQVQYAFLQGIVGKEIVEIEEQYTTTGEVVNCHIHLCNKGNVSAQKINLQLQMPEGLAVQTTQVQKAVLEPGDEINEVVTVAVKDLIEDAMILPKLICTYEYLVGGEWVQKEYRMMGNNLLKIQAPIIEIGDVKTSQNTSQCQIALDEKVTFAVDVSNLGNSVAKISTVMFELPEAIELTTEVATFKHIQIQTGELIPLEMTFKGIGVVEEYDVIMHLQYEYNLDNGDTYMRELIYHLGSIGVHDPNIEETNESLMTHVEEKIITIGEVIHYRLQVHVPGNRPANEIKVMLPEVAYGEWYAPKGLEHRSLKPGEQTTFCYELAVTELPDDYQVVIIPEIQYAFTVREETKVRRIQLKPQETAVQVAKIGHGTEGVLVQSNVNTAQIGDSIEIYMQLENTGNIPAEQVQVQIELEEGLEWIEGTLVINGEGYRGTIDDITPLVIKAGEINVIRYRVKVTKMPSGEYFEGRCFIGYTYKVQGREVEVEEEVKLPQIVIKDPDIRLETYQLPSQCDRGYADLEEFIHYSMVIDVRGNIPIQDSVVEICCSEALLLEDIERNVHIPEINPGEQVVLNYKAQVKTLEDVEKVECFGRLKYSFENHEGERVQQELRTQVHTTHIATAGPKNQEGLWIEEIKESFRFGEIIDFKIALRNDGNQSMEHTKLSIVCEEPFFEIVEVMNGDRVFTFTQDEVELGTLLPYEKITLFIKAKIVKLLDAPNQYVKGILQYAYSVDPHDKVKIKQQETNSVEVFCKDCGLSDAQQTALSVNQECAKIHDVLSYSVKLSNQGNTLASGVEIILEFNEGVDGLKEHIEVGIIDIGETYETTLKKTVINIPSAGVVSARGSVKYSCEDDNHRLRRYERVFGVCETNVQSPYFGQEGFLKMVDKEEITIGEMIKHEVYCENTGNTCAQNVILNYELPIGLAFKEERSGQLLLGNLKAQQSMRVELETYATGEIYRVPQEGKMWLTYDIVDEKGTQVVTLNDTKPTKYMVKSPRIQITFETKEKYAIVDNQVNYTLTLENTGNCVAEGVKLIQCVPEEIEIEKMPDRLVGALGIGERVSIDLVGTVKKRPLTGISEHQGVVEYTFMLRGTPYVERVVSDAFSLEIEEVNLEIIQQLEKNRSKLEVGEEVVITLKVMNVGTLATKQMMLRQIAVPGIVFVGGSFKANEQVLDISKIEKGINIGQLLPNQNLKLDFKLKIEAYSKQEIKWSNFVEYLYEHPYSGELIEKKSAESMTELTIISPYREKHMYETRYLLPFNMPDIKKLNKMTIGFQLIQVESCFDGSSEMLLKGVLDYKLQYIDDEECNQQVMFKKIWMNTVQRQGLVQDVIPEIKVKMYDQSEELINPREIQVKVKFEVEQR